MSQAQQETTGFAPAAPAPVALAEAAAANPRAAFERALHDLDLALLARPDSPELQCMRARALLGLGRDCDARATYLAVLRRNPDHLEALTNLGRNLATNGFRAEARPFLERAAHKHPDNAVSLVNLGTLLYQCEESTAARALYEKALRLEPANPLAHAGLSFVLSRLGEETLAVRHRRLGFAGRAIVALPFRGTGTPVPVLLLASAYNGNVPIERHLDDRTFRTWIVTPEFLGAGETLPPHRLVVNAIGDVDAAPQALRAAQAVLARSSAPVVNHPARVAATGRCENLARLADLPGVRAPRARRIARRELRGAVPGDALRAAGMDFPLLLRSPGYHTGEHFVRVDAAAELPAALERLPGDEIIALEFVDARGADGRIRKYRVMMIAGELYPLHLAIGREWKLHYFSADMACRPEHRAEEERFLRDMPAALGARAMRALREIQDRLGLDYAGIDFSLAPDGGLIVFEANATMAVFAPDPDPRWNYRRAAVAAIDAAVRRMLLGGAPRRPAPGPSPAPRKLRGNDLNFSAGPGALPHAVLDQAQQAVVALPETGLSVLGMSHRSAWFEKLLAEAESNLRGLLGIPDSHAVLFLQGGSSLQFSMLAMNFAPQGAAAPHHVRSGYWSAKAIEEARCVRPLEVAWDGQPGGYRTLPLDAELDREQARRAPYLHYVSNETVEGLQFAAAPALQGVALIADMSSDFLSRRIDFPRHAMIYAHAQKNLGPAGVTVCVIERTLLERIPAGLPPMLDYRTHLRHRSNYNTPPVFGIYVMTLVTRWLRDTVGGIEAMARINGAKAARLYGTLDALDGLAATHAPAPFRSHMNASFRFSDARLDARFLEQAAAAGFSGLAGHRALGGIRASLYNAVSAEAVDSLCEFIAGFAAANA